MVMYLWKIISTFYKDNSEILIVTSIFLDFTPPIAKPTVKLLTKQKQRHSAKKVIKDIK